MKLKKIMKKKIHAVLFASSENGIIDSISVQMISESTLCLKKLPPVCFLE